MITLQLCVVTRASLIAALLGQRPKAFRSVATDQPPQMELDEIGLLYQEGGATVPAAIVVQPNALADFFAWLDTYAPQFAPITQYCRVMLPEDIKLYSGGRVGRGNARLVRALAGVVVGEVIAQTVNVAMRSLDGATLGQAQSTFSLCLARSELLRAAGNDFRGGVLNALEVLSKMGVLSGRLVSIEDLLPFWAVAFGLPHYAVNVSEPGWLLAEAIEELSAASLSPSTILKLARHYEPARELMMLRTYSAEERVKIFDRLNAEVGMVVDERARAVEDFCLAYAAVEIGGGSTRHANLLQDYGQRRPLVWLWFGLLASIGEVDKWHPAFARVGKLVQRELEYSFDPWDPPRADLSVNELVSLQRGSSRPSWLVDLPRAHARALAVEVAAGVPFQFSIGSGERKDVPMDPAKADVSRLDEAMAALWAFRQSLVSGDVSNDVTHGKSSRRSKSAKARKDGLF